MENPWQTLAIQQIYENPWIRIEHRDVLNPAGKPGIYGVIHFQNHAVGIVPYEDDHIWLVGQYRYVLDQYSWEIPEGGCPMHELPLAAALRELKEETGMTASYVEPLLQMHLSNSVSTEWGIVYLATGLAQGEAEPEDTEDLRIKRVSVEEAYEAVERGEITDSLTVAAIYKLMLLRAQGKLSTFGAKSA